MGRRRCRRLAMMSYNFARAKTRSVYARRATRHRPVAFYAGTAYYHISEYTAIRSAGPSRGCQENAIAGMVASCRKLLLATMPGRGQDKHSLALQVRALLQLSSYFSVVDRGFGDDYDMRHAAPTGRVPHAALYASLHATISRLGACAPTFEAAVLTPSQYVLGFRLRQRRARRRRLIEPRRLMRGRRAARHDARWLQPFA